MDNLTHTLVGLVAAKAGLERVSPYATAVCLVAANAPDADVVALAGGRWFYLHHHRGITHSFVGTLALALLVPVLFYAVERLVARVRRKAPRARLGGLVVASLAVGATHPLLDWTNNYGLRPFLPWSAEWYYGDLVFILDPWLWLALGGAAFLATAGRARRRVAAWGVVAVLLSAALYFALPRAGMPHPELAVAVWLAGLSAFAAAYVFRLNARRPRAVPALALASVVVYWCALAFAHGRALGAARGAAQAVAQQAGEGVREVAAMPTLADPTGWLVVFETERATYRYKLRLTETGAAPTVERFEKPQGAEAELVARVTREDYRAQVLMGFARFPTARLRRGGCAAETVLQLADLRYTEPGSASRRASGFAVEITVK